LLILYTVQFSSFDQSLPGLPLCTGLAGRCRLSLHEKGKKKGKVDKRFKKVLTSGVLL
jgi:hypothetical protein